MKIILAIVLVALSLGFSWFGTRFILGMFSAARQGVKYPRPGLRLAIDALMSLFAPFVVTLVLVRFADGIVSPALVIVLQSLVGLDFLSYVYRDRAEELNYRADKLRRTIRGGHAKLDRLSRR